VSVHKGDITAENVDIISIFSDLIIYFIIANAANEHLWHGGGVAGAISSKGGPYIFKFN
jgi:O-acetyl-ADP-ribose deacetylase (regulator of RNase III)